MSGRETWIVPTAEGAPVIAYPMSLHQKNETQKDQKGKREQERRRKLTSDLRHPLWQLKNIRETRSLAL
jgi:hypothetical protein